MEVWFRRLTAAYPLAVAMMAPSGARAQGIGYNNFQVGDRALGLAGAYVGLADDASAVFHNPGGLALLPKGTLSTNLWAQALQVTRVQGGFRTDLGSKSLSEMRFLGLPFFVAATAPVGPADASGRRRHALGAMIASPYSRDVQFNAQIEGQGAQTGLDAVDRFASRVEDSSTWVGIAYGYRPLSNLSLGLTTFVANRSYAVQQSRLRVERGTIAELSESSAQDTQFRVTGNQYNLLWRLGAVWDPSSTFRTGLMVQPPGPAISKSLSLEGVTWSVHPETNGVDFVALSGARPGFDATMPWEVRVGGTYFAPSNDRATLDLSVIGARKEGGSLRRAIEDATGTVVPLTVAGEHATLRSAFGYETAPQKFVPVRGGVLYEMEPAPNLRAGGGKPRQVFGGSFSASLSFGRYQIGLGATVTHARRTIRFLEVAPDGAASVHNARVGQTTVYAFLSGGSRAAARLVDDLGHLIEKRKGSKEPAR